MYSMIKNLIKFKKLTALALMLMLIMTTLSGCFEEYEEPDIETFANDSLMKSITTYNENDTWAIYWYLCGTDLETNYGSATSDLEEMFKVTLPDNVKVIIETGGTYSWQNDFVPNDSLARYVYSGNELELIETAAMSSMGNKATFERFLKFCNTNYPADHVAVVMWDHGGGSMSGICFDEVYDYEGLSLLDLREAFDSVYSLSEGNPPIEMIGFDACLMATIDTAYTFRDIAKYLVASEETEPGCGWEYSGWLDIFNKEKSLNGAVIGKAICDTYVQGCKDIWQADEITLSVIDLTKISALMSTYHNIGVEALAAACENPNYLSTFGRAADSAEKYGPNDKNEGYTNLVDIGDLVKSASSQLPDSSAQINKALNECVVYKINGTYRKQASGLSCYYPYDMDKGDYDKYVKFSYSPAYDYLYGYMINGKLSKEGAKYVKDMKYEDVEAYTIPDTPIVSVSESNLPSVTEISDVNLEDFPLYIDDDGYAVLDIGSANADMLSGVYFELCYYDEEDDSIIFLGTDNDIDMDWDNGVFKDNFRGVWGAIDGNLVYMEITYEGDDYNLYSIPILLNGKECYLRVSYDYNTEKYEILGARLGLSDNGMSDRNLIKLEVGDTITTLHYVYSYDDEEKYSYEGDTFTVTKKTSFDEVDLPDGTYVLMFQMVDVRNNSAYSDAVYITVEGDEFYFDTE